MSERRVKGRLIETAVVLYPPSNNRVEHTSYVVERFVTSIVEGPAPERPTHGFSSSIAYRGSEVNEVFTPTILGPPGTKRVPQEVKLLVAVVTAPVIILAVDDLRLLRMKLQTAVREPSL
jgi:hypothetical protein